MLIDDYPKPDGFWSLHHRFYLLKLNMLVQLGIQEDMTVATFTVSDIQEWWRMGD
jgi:hypothetical protein